MSKVQLLSATGLLALALAAAPAGATPMFGSGTYLTARSCSSVTAADACDGTGPGQAIFDSALSGGASLTSSTTLTLGDGSSAYGAVSFGALDLPVIKGSADALGDVRMNSNDIGYQSYVYTGSSSSPLSFTGVLDIADSSTDGGDGTLPDGAIYSAYVAIWDPSIVGSITDPYSIFTNFYADDCSLPGVLAYGYSDGALSGGAASLSVTTVGCSTDPYIINPGDEVLAVAGFQIPVNRGGYVDASDTFTIELDPTLSEDVRANLTANLLSGKASIPEPATLLLVGAGLAGMGMGRRRNRKQR